MHTIFVAGATGYLGRALIPKLIGRGHRVLALTRSGSTQKLPTGCEIIVGEALTPQSWAPGLVEADTIVHLIGVAHPSPSKALEFERVDLGSVRAMLSALHRASAGAPQTDAGNPKHAVRHIVYLSVARPAPVMLAYQRVREEAEALITSSGIAASFLRPWYVLGPGHRWPLLLLPLYWLLAALPSTRASAQRLGLVSLRQMVNALVEAVESPPQVTHIVDVPAIRRAPAT